MLRGEDFTCGRPQITAYALIVVSTIWRCCATSIASHTADGVRVDTAGLRGSIAASSRSSASEGAGTNPLILEYRRKAQAFEQAAREAEQASAAWAAKTRAAVYGGGAITAERTRVEMKRRGYEPWARAVWQVEKMLKDPSFKQAQIAAAQAAAPYEERYREYKKTQLTYNVSATGFANGAARDESLATKLLAYATQYRLQGDSITADQYVHQATMLRRQETAYRGFADKYRNTVERIDQALPTIQRLAEGAARYAAWEQNPKGAIDNKDVFPYTLAPPLNPIPPTTTPVWQFPSQNSNLMSVAAR